MEIRGPYEYLHSLGHAACAPQSGFVLNCTFMLCMSCSFACFFFSACVRLLQGPSRLELSKPLIAAVSGFAVAGGLELALLADLRVVEESAVMGVFCRRFGKSNTSTTSCCCYSNRKSSAPFVVINKVLRHISCFAGSISPLMLIIELLQPCMAAVLLRLQF